MNGPRSSRKSLARRQPRSYVKNAEANAYEAGKQDAIVERVTQATSFWRNLPGNIAVGVASSFAFAVLLIAASVVLNKDPSPIALYQKLTTPAQPASPPPK